MAVMTIGAINDVRGDVSSVVSNLGAPDNEVIEEEPNGIIDFSQARITLSALAGILSFWKIVAHSVLR